MSRADDVVVDADGRLRLDADSPAPEVERAPRSPWEPRGARPGLCGLCDPPPPPEGGHGPPCALSAIVALVADGAGLWGLPYVPRGLPRAPRSDWRWLGAPGWWCSIPGPEIAVLEPWIAALAEARPRPGEWCELADWGLSPPATPTAAPSRMEFRCVSPT